MRISVTVTNSKTKSPVADAKVVLRVDDKELVTLYTDGAGKAGHTERTQRAGKILSWSAEADGFEFGKGELEIDQPDNEVTVYLVPEAEERPPAPPVASSASPPPEPPQFFIVDDSGDPVHGAEVFLEQRGEPVGYGISTQGVVMPSSARTPLKHDVPVDYHVDKEGFHSVSGQLALSERPLVQGVKLAREQSPAPSEESIPTPTGPLQFFIVDDSGKPLDGADVFLDQGDKRVGYGISEQGAVMPFGNFDSVKQDEPVVFQVKKDGFRSVSGQLALNEDSHVKGVTLAREKRLLRRLLKWTMWLVIIALAYLVGLFGPS